MWYQPGYVFSQGPKTVKRISFLAFGSNTHHRGTVVTSESVELTINELAKDYDAVLCTRVRLANGHPREDVTIFDAITNIKII